MGAMYCDRNGCENAMCDRLIDARMYICDECFDELVGTGPDTDIDEFMASEKKSPRLKRRDGESAYDRYNRICVNRHDPDDGDDW